MVEDRLSLIEDKLWDLHENDQSQRRERKTKQRIKININKSSNSRMINMSLVVKEK